jgi:hypothetical protein
MARLPKPDRLSPKLRHQADRPASPRRKPPADLLAAARRGYLTKSSTVKGTAGRQAADRVIYEKRVAQRAKPGRPVREAAGHVGPTTPTATAGVVLARNEAGQPVVLQDVELSRRDVHRAARHASLVRQLLNGRISPRAFRARVQGWAPFIVLGPPELAGTYRFEPDPDVVPALAEVARAEGAEVVFTS